MTLLVFFATATGTGIVATELFVELLVTPDDAAAALHVRLRGIALAAFARDFDERAALQFVCSFS